MEEKDARESEYRQIQNTLNAMAVDQATTHEWMKNANKVTEKLELEVAELKRLREQCREELREQIAKNTAEIDQAKALLSNRENYSRDWRATLFSVIASLIALSALLVTLVKVKGG